jgi:hypothetical protein
MEITGGAPLALANGCHVPGDLGVKRLCRKARLNLQDGRKKTGDEEMDFQVSQVTPLVFSNYCPRLQS